MTKIGPMAWTAAWLGVLDRAPLGGSRASDGDVISPLVAELIAYEVVSQRDAA